MRFREKLAQLMYGRYGKDNLGVALLVLYGILLVINIFVRSYLIYLLELFIVAVALFRMMSRNYYKRQQENLAYLKLETKIKPYFNRGIRRIKDIKTHRYRKCRQCGVVLRLPRKTGKHTVVCPHCKAKFKVRILF